MPKSSPLRFLVINNAEAEMAEFSDPIVKILGRAQMYNKSTWVNPFTESDMTRNAKKTLYSTKEKIPSQKPDREIDAVVVYWNDLIVKKGTNGSSTDDVSITYTLYDPNGAIDSEGYSRTETLSEFDAIISTGSPQGDDPMESHSPHYNWLLSTDIPFLGICCGHHLVAHKAGLPLIRDGSQSETGNMTVTVVEDDPIFKGLNVTCHMEAFDQTTRGGRRVPQSAATTVGTSITVRQMHNDAIALPEGFRTLASSPRCEVNMMRDLRRKLFYSTQFHPEYLNPQLIYNFVDLVQNPPEREAYTPVERPPPPPKTSGMFMTEGGEKGAAEAKKEEVSLGADNGHDRNDGTNSEAHTGPTSQLRAS